MSECTANSFCYCVNSDIKDAILNTIDSVRKRIADQRAEGRAIGYLSVPISSVGGGYYGINIRVAAETKLRLEQRLGSRAAWLLNPASSDFALPPGATGADYMLLWTKVLEGEDGLGKDFDFVYFVGPSDFSRHFPLDGRADLEKLESYYDELVKTEPALRQIDKISFRNYYGLRASVSFSLGSHDEWNIVRAINAQRRGESKALDGGRASGTGTGLAVAGRHKAEFGIPNQLAVLFDGQAVEPGLFESLVAPGTAGACALR